MENLLKRITVPSSAKTFFRNLCCLTLLFWGVAEAAAGEAPHCAASLLLPAGVHLLETPGCFSLDTAADLSSDPEGLHTYLARFPDTAAADQYRYWYYLRTRHFLPALLTLVRLVNSGSSLAPARQFRDELAFVVLSGIKSVPPEIDLYGKDTILDHDISHRFFFILDQVAALYAADNSDLRRDAWLLYRSLALFFSSSGIPQSADPHTDALFKYFYLLWREGDLLSYLDFYTFFTGGSGDYLPSAEIYRKRFAQSVPLPKSGDPREEREMLASVSRIMARLLLERLPLSPRIEFVQTDDIHPWYRTNRLTGSSLPGRDPRCLVFDEREGLLAPYQEDLFQPFIENKALALMEWCDQRHLPPVVIEAEKVYLSTADRWFSDAAVAYALIMMGSFSYREAANLMSGALLSALRRYLGEGRKRPFGEVLLYAYHTGRLSLFRDALFLHRKYEEDADYTNEKKRSAVRFTTLFFLGTRGREP